MQGSVTPLVAGADAASPFPLAVKAPWSRRSSIDVPGRRRRRSERRREATTCRRHLNGPLSHDGGASLIPFPDEALPLSSRGPRRLQPNTAVADAAQFIKRLPKASSSGVMTAPINSSSDT